MSSLRDEVLAEFKRVQIDLLYTEKAHFCSAEHFKGLHYVLGGAAAIASAIMAGAAVDKDSTPSIVVALVATLAAALVTFVKPLSQAGRHVVCARQLADLRFRMRQSETLDGHPSSGVSDSALRQLVAGFTTEKQQLLSDAPTTGPIAFWRAQRKIKAGHFGYDDAP